jgi:hypothetical protein
LKRRTQKLKLKKKNALLCTVSIPWKNVSGVLKKKSGSSGKKNEGKTKTN